MEVHYQTRFKANDPIRPDSNKPEKRHDIILEALESTQKYNIISHSDCSVEINELLHVTSNDYLSFLEKIYPHHEKEKNRDLTSSCGSGVVPINFTHIKPRSNNPYAEMSYYARDMMTPIHSSTYGRVIDCINVVKHASKSIINGTNVAYALTILPGHHASYSSYGGYCFLNNAFFAANFISIETLAYVAILDIDYHHANGTQELANAHRSSTMTSISIHMNPNYDYPYYSGEKEDSTEYHTNMPIYPSSNIKKEYLDTVDLAVNMIASTKSMYLVVSLGFDTLVTDPDAQVEGGCGLTPENFYDIGFKIGSLLKNGLKILVVQEGGYDLKNIPRAARKFMAGLNSHN